MKLCCPFQVSLFIKLIMKIKREKIFIHIFSAPPTNIRHKMYASALNVFKFVFINLFFIFEVPYLQYLIFCIIFHHPVSRKCFSSRRFYSENLVPGCPVMSLQLRGAEHSCLERTGLVLGFKPQCFAVNERGRVSSPHCVTFSSPTSLSGRLRSPSTGVSGPRRG